MGESIVAIACALALVIAPITARAEEVAGALEPGAEKTADACQDKADNDSDGRTDCADSDCRNFSFCSDATRTKGYWMKPLVAGAVLIPVALALAFGSIPLWNDATDRNHPPLNQHLSGQDGVDLAGAAILTAAGVGLAVGGAVLLARGIVRQRKWHAAQAFVPRLAAGPNGAAVGIGGTW